MIELSKYDDLTFPQDQCRYYKLKNGLMLAYLPEKYRHYGSQPIEIPTNNIYMMIVEFCGQMHQSKPEIAHAAEHYVSWKLSTDSDTSIFMNTFDASASLHLNHTVFRRVFDTEQFEQIVEKTGSVLFNPKVEDDDVTNILHQLKNQYAGRIVSDANYDYHSLIYGENRPWLRFVEPAKQMDLTHINKKRLQEYLDNHFSPTNTLVIIGGDVPVGIESIVSRHFQDYESGENKIKAVNPAIPLSSSHVLAFPGENGKSYENGITIIIPGDIEPDYSFQVALGILVGERSGRLNEDRYHGPKVGWWFSSNYDRYSRICTIKWWDTVPVNTKRVFDFFKDIRTNTVTNDELKEAKYKIARRLLMNNEWSQIMTAIKEQCIVGVQRGNIEERISTKQYLRGIFSVTQKDVIEAAKRCFPSSLDDDTVHCLLQKRDSRVDRYQHYEVK